MALPKSAVAQQAALAEAIETRTSTTVTRYCGAEETLGDTQCAIGKCCRLHYLGARRCRTKAWRQGRLADKAHSVIVTWSAERTIDGATGHETSRAMHTQAVAEWRHAAVLSCTCGRRKQDFGGRGRGPEYSIAQRGR